MRFISLVFDMIFAPNFSFLDQHINRLFSYVVVSIFKGSELFISLNFSKDIIATVYFSLDQRKSTFDLNL